MEAVWKTSTRRTVGGAGGAEQAARTTTPRRSSERGIKESPQYVFRCAQRVDENPLLGHRRPSGLDSIL